VRRQIFFVAFVLSLAGATALAQSPDPAGSPQQPTPQACAPNCPQPPAKPAANPDTPAQPKPKVKRVYTNEDFDARPHTVTVEGSRDLLQTLNTCDRNCFDEVAQRASISGGYSSRWKLMLLEAVDVVRADSAWQEILGEILGIKGEACELQVKKTEDLQKLSDPRTVTPAELNVEREYEPKFREIQNRLNALLSRANAHIAKTSQNVLQTSYMQLQLDRLGHATCRINVPRPPDDTDDPDDP